MSREIALDNICLQHDDFVWTSSAFLHPDIYRRIIIPRYAVLWKSVHEAGKKVLFCSDVNIMEFVDDIAATGAGCQPGDKRWRMAAARKAAGLGAALYTADPQGYGQVFIVDVPEFEALPDRQAATRNKEVLT